MRFLRVFAAIVVEVWRQIEPMRHLADHGMIMRGVLTVRWLRAFELAAEAIVNRLVLTGVVSEYMRRSGYAP